MKFEEPPKQSRRAGQLQKDSGIYHGVAKGVPLPLSQAISAIVGWRRIVTFPLSVFQTTAAGSAATAHGAPFAPATVHRRRSGAHGHAFLVNAPLKKPSSFYSSAHSRRGTPFAGYIFTKNFAK